MASQIVSCYDSRRGTTQPAYSDLFPTPTDVILGSLTINEDLTAQDFNRLDMAGTTTRWPVIDMSFTNLDALNNS
jgi:hypothetical protein